MQTTMRLEIQKHNRGWSCTSIVKYPGWSNDAITNSGQSTLASVLWHKVGRCIDLDAKLLSITVNGKDMPFDKVWEIVYKALVDGGLAYELPKIKKLLEV